MATQLDETLRALESAREKDNAVCVAYSGGKDSMVVLDLAMRTFARVEAFFMYLVPGLECCEALLDQARRRYGVQIRQYPHWQLRDLILRGVYCANTWKQDDLPPYTLRDVYLLARTEAKCQFLMTGAKRSDGAARRRYFTNTQSWDDVLYPVAGWSKYDVFGYLAAQGIKPPATFAGVTTGVDVTPKSLLWLHDTHPSDFRRVCEAFPYAEAVVYRRKWYGIEK
jgi:phosphoadenosine phosphosulfate reductase